MTSTWGYGLYGSGNWGGAGAPWTEINNTQTAIWSQIPSTSWGDGVYGSGNWGGGGALNVTWTEINNTETATWELVTGNW